MQVAQNAYNERLQQQETLSIQKYTSLEDDLGQESRQKVAALDDLFTTKLLLKTEIEKRAMLSEEISQRRRSELQVSLVFF